MEGVEEGSSQLEVQETRQEQDTQKSTTPPQYEDLTHESDLEILASSSAPQSKRKRKFSWTLEQEEDLIDGYRNSYYFFIFLASHMSLIWSFSSRPTCDMLPPKMT